MCTLCAFFIIMNGHRHDVREPFLLAAFVLVKNGSSHDAGGAPFPFLPLLFPCRSEERA